jgi:putative glycosyltransferase (TIGR04372 family)
MLSKKGWHTFLSALKKRDYSTVMYLAYMSVGLRFLAFLCAVPIILILWILKPVFWLKVGKLHSERLGHFSWNTDLFLRRRQLGIYPDGPFYCFLCDPTKVANHQILTMWKRTMPVYESRALSVLFERMLPILKKTPFHQDLPGNSNEYYEFNNAKPSLYFTPEEIEKGRKLLYNMNVDLDTDEFVCIFSRDNAYLKDLDSQKNWDYQNTRDSDIDLFIETAKHLIEKGFVVIRIGSVVSKPINFSHNKMIDYPYSGHRSDFLDIFLTAHSKFIISAGSSGCTDVGIIFNTPTLTVDLADWGYAPLIKNSLHTPKIYKYINTGDHLRFEDGLKLGDFWNNPTAFGLETEAINPQDILEATKEMLARLEGSFRYSAKDENLIQAYHKLWGESGARGSSIKTPIGIAWLKKNQALYF